MSSQRRIDSSRANGAKSRGPVTPEGKRKSSANAIRHGFLAESVVLDVERAPAFYDLLNDLIREHNAETETQLNLIETMTMARWRIARLWAIEREILQTEMEKPEHESDDVAANLTKAFRALADRDGILGLLNRYEARLDRQYSRALNLLIKLADPASPFTKFRETNPVGQASRPVQVAEGGGAHPNQPEASPEPESGAESEPAAPETAPNPPHSPVFPPSCEIQSQNPAPDRQNPLNHLLPTG